MTLPDEEYSAADLKALRRAMAIMSKEPVRRQQLEGLLEGEPWGEVAEFAASHCQRKSLGLKPWQDAPCNANGEDTEAARLLRLMEKAGISRFEPKPLAALKKAERK
jgi:hypothetical protein